MIEYVIKGQCWKLKDVPHGARIEKFHGRDVIARCGDCGWPITKDDDDADGSGDVWLCGRCSILNVRKEE